MENISPDNILMQLSDPRNLADVLRLSSLPESTDLSMFLPQVVNLMAHSDLMSELLLLAVNTLLKDLQDSNPTIRALALRTICSVNHEAFIEHRLQCVSLALGDSSAYVRRAATVAVVSAFRGDIDSVKDAGIVNRLYELIRDSDPIVVVCVIARTLQDPEGQISALYLLGHLDDGGVDSEVLYCIEDYIEQFPDLDIQSCTCRHKPSDAPMFLCFGGRGQPRKKDNCGWVGTSV
ncbi:AP4B1-like protein [Mya arenaria]|uniref:AP4B1-like protein n=1 Tax=Mya arenaria TaxID=6604 RepID=A0ABY7EJB6_MYAAR|nr:AP4B1-like protein [Mya arenaria]